MWEENKLEHLLKKKLLEDLPKSDAEALFGNYTTARDALLKQVLEEIKSQESDLTDHGPNHVADVMDNVFRLIESARLDGRSIFLLAVATLYHDVGNIFGREKHNLALLKVFNDTYPKSGQAYKRVKSLVNTIAGAHTGKARDGSKDTLKDLTNSDSFMKDKVHPRELAAILRFADELAEGPQRTSSYKIKHKLIDSISMIYHAYAICCEPAVIDEDNQRIALTYPISIKNQNGTLYLHECEITLEDMLTYIYTRVHKLDVERKYCKHYAPKILNQFVKVSAVFEFWLDDDEQLHFDKNPLELDDLVNLDDELKIPSLNPSFLPATIVNDLQGQIDDHS